MKSNRIVNQFWPQLLPTAVLLLYCAAANAASESTLTASLDHILSAAPKGATYVARVLDASTGQELYVHDPDRPVAPASNAKLSNVAAGLDRFGPDYLWRTYLAIEGDDLWLIGTGDPSCGDRRIEAWHDRERLAILDDFADALAKRNITHIKGNLVFDDSIFDDERVGPDWPKSELTDSWAAPLSGLTLCASCIIVTADSDHFEVIPETSCVKIINQTRATGEHERFSIERAAHVNVFTVKGLLTKKEESDDKAIVDPGYFFADALRTRLKARGIVIDGKIERCPRPAAAKWAKLKDSDQRDDRVVAVHETRLADVIKRIDKESQNLFADALAKLQGRAWDHQHGEDNPGSWRAAGPAVHDFLKRMEIDDSKYVFVDGSGMSAANRVTARLISDLLTKMAKHRYAKEFRDSLSICGKDGTLDDRMMDITGQVHGKSGTIDGVKALSGYLTTHTGQELIFSMIYNNAPNGTEKHCQDLLDDACRAMVKWTPGIAQH